MSTTPPGGRPNSPTSASTRAAVLGGPDLAQVYIAVRVGLSAIAMAISTVAAATAGRSELWILPLLAVPSIVDGLARRRSGSTVITGPLVLDITMAGVFVTLLGLETVTVAYTMLIGAGAAVLLPRRVIAGVHTYLIAWMLAAFTLNRVTSLGDRCDPTMEAVFTVLHVAVTFVGLTVVVRVVVDRLRWSSEQRSRLVGGITHDMKNALTGAVGMARLLEQSNSDLPRAEIVEIAGLVASEGTEALSLVEDLLTATRAEAGELSIVEEELALDAEVASAIAHLRSSDDSTQRLTVDLAPVAAIGDSLRVRQIVRNLVSNAQRYGGDRIRITTRNANGVATVKVSDSGPPIPDKHREAMFQAFAQVARHRTEGVGLGLTMSRYLSRNMGGDTVYDHDGEWGTFTLSLPVCDPPEPPGGDGVILTDSEQVSLRDDGILVTRVRPNAHVTLDDARAGVQAYQRLAAGTRRPILVLADGLGFLDRDARNHFTRSEASAACIAAAALVVRSSLVARTFVNSINYLTDTPFPTRVFEEEDVAIAWLRTFITDTTQEWRAAAG